jgi:ATP-dependent DNA ligase
MINKSLLKNNKGYFTGNESAITKEIVNKALNYKKKVASAYSALNREQILTFLPESDFLITKKIDGELQILVYEGEELFSVNGYGNVKYGLPCFEELKKNLQAKKIKTAVLAGELHVDEASGRKRVYDLLKELGQDGNKELIHLTLFDIIELDEKLPNVDNYKETVAQLDAFTGGKVHAVTIKEAKTKEEVKSIFDTFLEANAEGIVVRGSFPRVYKVKPKYNIDAAVVGFSESEEKGKVRSLLLALMNEDGTYQVIGKAGSGLNDDLRVWFYNLLAKTTVESSFVETDSNNVAFHMVKPEHVVEVGCNDIMIEMASEPVTNAVIEFKDDKYNFNSMMYGATLLFPVFERIREDKKVNTLDVRWQQLENLVVINHVPTEQALANLPKSELISRDVYRKELKGKILVQKFVVLKTNKEKVDRRFPAYVFHYTNYSPDRKDPIDKEVRISNDLNQINEIKSQYLEENIKKGWEKA